MDAESQRETIETEATQVATDRAACLREFIEENADELLQTIALFVRKAGLAAGSAAEELSLELLSEVCCEALKKAECYDPARLAGPWLLGIAANLIKRKRVENAKRTKRDGDVATLARLAHVAVEQIADEDLFDWFAGQTGTDPADAVLTDETVEHVLALVSDNDREILTLAVINDLSGERIAQELGIKPGAARVRLSRALNRLRAAMKDAGVTLEGIER